MTAAIIVAAGKGIRMGHRIPKQYLPVGNLPILSHTLCRFNTCDLITEIILVIPKTDFKYCLETILPQVNPTKTIHLTAGGEMRQQSVFNGLKAVSNHQIVLIHDGVRPFVRTEQIETCIREAETSGACILGIQAFDTLKKTDESSNIIETISREFVWLAQTPQAFRYDLIYEAHEQAEKEGFIGTDDASLVERLGVQVKIISGSRDNIKITTSEDLQWANVFGFSG